MQTLDHLLYVRACWFEFKKVFPPIRSQSDNVFPALVQPYLRGFRTAGQQIECSLFADTGHEIGVPDVLLLLRLMRIVGATDKPSLTWYGGARRDSQHRPRSLFTLTFNLLPSGWPAFKWFFVYVVSWTRGLYRLVLVHAIKKLVDVTFDKRAQFSEKNSAACSTYTFHK